jgi:zinc transport system substrate-binding protein
MKLLKIFIGIVSFCAGCSIAAPLPVLKNGAPKVLVSIRPLYGIAASLLEGVGTPELLLETRISPHVYNLRPGDVSRVKDADILFWVGPAYEGFLTRLLGQMAESKQVQVQKIPQITQYTLRTDGLWGDTTGHDHHHGHSHEGHHHEPGSIDGHMWLDVANGRLIAKVLAARLIELDPTHAHQYKANLVSFLKRMDILQKSLEEQVREFHNRSFLVFHDAYQYMEKSLHLKVVGSILLEPDIPAGAHHINRLHALIKMGRCNCIFSEPQFALSLVKSLSENTNVPVALLDPLGSDIPLSPQHYEQMFQALVGALKGCLKK